ncbi:MAG: acyltransferase [Clostridia bacterium]|nr:acyltransferase [Clostridia bacterium]
MFVIKKIINKIKFILRNRNSKSKVEYLKKVGAKIGEKTVLLCSTDAFGTEPYLITVGKNCLMSGEVYIITHDGGVNVLNNLRYFDGTKMDKIAPVKIGDNVYIGYRAIIMPGVTIGNNVLIGAGAIVTRDIPDNSVAVGVPARCVKNIDEYYESGKEKNQFFPTVSMYGEEKKEYILKHIGDNCGK